MRHGQTLPQQSASARLARDAEFRPKPFDASFDPKQMMEGLSAGFGPMEGADRAADGVDDAGEPAGPGVSLGIPQRLSRCRTQADILNEQMRFWQTAMSQYQDATSRIATAWGELFSTVTQSAGAGQASGPVVFPKKAAVKGAATAKPVDLVRATAANARAS